MIRNSFMLLSLVILVLLKRSLFDSLSSFWRYSSFTKVLEARHREYFKEYF